VVVRVAYRVLFGGAGGDGPILLPLPSLRLPAPFAHVSMLGPVAADGLGDAIAGALPIAAAIMGFGLLNALIDVARVFARVSRRGPLRGIARALAIAWATLPALADAVRAVRLAQRLRGERAWVRMLVPLLQRTLERAGAVAAALELRGFAGRGLEGACEAPADARSVALGFRAAAVGGGATADPLLLQIDELSFQPGSLTVLSGPTGSGKSTVLRALAGLHTHVDGGWLTGSLRVVGHDRVAVAPRDLARQVGVVLQHPREAFATERVRDEIALALELRGVAPVIVSARVDEVAGRVGIAHLLERPTRGLSAGEATLVAIAAAIVDRPILLLVDEPLADLDSDARSRVVRVLDELAHAAGVCVVVAEHRVDVIAEVADAFLGIEHGVVRAGAPALGGPSASGTTGAVRAERSPSRAGEAVLRASDVTVTHRRTLAVAAADLELRAGELVALVGPNGAGKSSLLAALALPGRHAQIDVAGRVALVPDASDDLFVYDTVAAECGRADRRAARESRREPGAGATAARFAGFLGLDPASPEFRARMRRHPRDLSVGERRCLVLAIQLATGPRVLLVDEPTRGLDPAARELVCRVLVSLAAEGAAVLVASHEPEMAQLADRVLSMRAGVLRAGAAEPRAAESAAARPEVPPPGLPHAAARPEVPQTPRAATPPERGPSGPGTAEIGRRARSQAELRHTRVRRLGRRGPAVALLAANVVALAAFCWPFLATALPQQAHAAVPVAALALAPLAALVVVATLDGSVRSAHMLALLGTLAAIGAAVRIAGTGAGGVEAVFILLILAGRAFGARFGLVLGIATIALSTAVTGGFGPWTPFQMFACAWVGAGAGLLPRAGRRAEIALLCVYGVVASYLFGLLMNLWFWPFAVGYGTAISYEGGAPLAVNLSNFLLYSLVTSTVGWDTLRAITTVIGILIVGMPVLAALRRTKPLAAPVAPPTVPSRAAVLAR
jgi:energy-coupling factor transport system ATP-binding protein